MNKGKTIENVSDYISYIEETKKEQEKDGNNIDFLFRGQNIDKPLLPKIARIKLRGNIENIEKLMLTEFKRGILPLSEFKPENEWDLLALAQHHGLPTRLLDWTYSALAALWFAVEKPPLKNINGIIEDGVVWILISNINDFRTDTEKITPLDNKITKIFRSTIISRRISAQAGVFTVHKINENSKFIALEKNSNYKRKLIKIIIPNTAFKNIRNRLNILGVNHSTLFPDIDGYCKYLEWRYSKYSDEILKKNITVKAPKNIMLTKRTTQTR